MKTLYTAPYIGAAKAAIAKFLRVAVSELDTVPQSSSQGTATTPGQSRSRKAQTTLQQEFDDNDDELSSFDLHAAVASVSPLWCQQKMNQYKIQKHTPTSFGKGSPS